MKREEAVNQLIKDLNIDANFISDGYHTFAELYTHRIALFIALCRMILKGPTTKEVWKSKKHHDGTMYKGWFIMGVGMKKGEQISYHLPMSYWLTLKDIATLAKAPEWDGHDSNEVVKRLLEL